MKGINDSANSKQRCVTVAKEDSDIFLNYYNCTEYDPIRLSALFRLTFLLLLCVILVNVMCAGLKNGSIPFM